MSKKKPCGIEAYDQSYGVGYKSGHDNYSPFERVNKLREVFLSREFDIDIQRARIVTEFYKANPNMPQVTKMAKSLEKILDEVDIYLYDDELIIGEIAAPAKAAPIYPEFSMDWIEDELKNHPFNERPNDKFFISDEDRDELLEMAKFWKGKTIENLVDERTSFDEKKGSEAGKSIYKTNLYHYAGIGHFVMDYESLLKFGYDKYIKDIEKKLDEIKGAAEGTGEKTAGKTVENLSATEIDEKIQLYEAMIISLNASKRFINRYAGLAEERVKTEKNGKRKGELKKIAENCKQIAGGPAKTMWQAIQLWYFATNITLIESNGHSISYGRMDQWLYPYYKEDMDKEVISKKFAQELLECAYIKTGNPSKLKDKDTVAVRNGRGWGGESLTIGGVDREGNDATNDLTFMMLEASAHTRMMNPWLCVRLHKNAPYELKVKAVECIKAGYGHPKLFNDEVAIPTVEKKGRTLEEARDYEVVGCVEPDTAGYEYGFHDAAYMNIVKILQLALNDGKCINCGADCPRYAECGAKGKTLGPNTGSLANFKNIEEVMESYDKQMAYWTEQMCNGLNIIDKVHSELKPLPYVSVFFHDCIENGKDLSHGGARYNHTGPQASGIATCADSISVINQLVFEEKKFTGAEMLQALEDNWEGHDVLYALVNGTKTHHYGNDDDYADRYFEEIFKCYCKNVVGKTNPRGGTFTPGVYSVNANVGLGLTTPATLDGRKAGEPISDNMGPVHTAAASHDIFGPTAIVNSVTKADHSLATNGTLLNMKFTPECVSGKAGTDNMVSFIDTYFSKLGMHVQFNIMSTAMMKAAVKKPEDYRDMLVRVAGYSAYFVELGKPLQMDLISRTELSFE